jgi:pimeloyl-ACP methyl ester carboxylesterase
MAHTTTDTPPLPHAAAAREVEFIVNDMKIAGKAWGDPNGIPTFALHGWLDNANTFDRLAPLLPELNLVALDFAGHGRSSWRPAGIHYEWVFDMQEILGIARQLGWNKFSLIGHSMGAAVASNLAGLFPEHIERAVMIDGFLGYLRSAARRVDSSRKAIEKMLDASLSKPPVYPTVQAMVERAAEATKQTLEASATLLARGHKAVPGGYTWVTDPRLRFPSAEHNSADEIEELMRRSTAPALLLVATEGDKWYRDGVSERQKFHPNLTVKDVTGRHHLHLEEQAPEVAALIRAFFGLRTDL